MPQFKRARFQKMAHERTFFRGRESFRFMSMLFMLALIAMLIFQAREPSMWRWIAPGSEPSSTEFAAEPTPKAEAPPTSETIIHGVADDDFEEGEAAKEEFQAIADRQPLDAAEMPSYWRLMRWIRSLSFDDAAARARRGVLFTHLWDAPSRHRGELIFLKLHLMRAIAHEPEASPNAAGVERVYEAWGTTSESGVHLYCVVFPEVPPGLKLGDDIREESDFVGYFLKQLPYHDKLDKPRAAPLLIGRLRWRENPARVALQNQNNALLVPTIAVGSLIVIVLVGSWVYNNRASRRLSEQSQLSPAEHGAIEKWIDQADRASSPLESSSAETSSRPPPRSGPHSDWPDFTA
jgi:hypothetical protein